MKVSSRSFAFSNAYPAYPGRPGARSSLALLRIGLLATYMLRLRGLEVITAARTRPPTLQAELAEASGANLDMVLGNKLAFGTVSSNSLHFADDRAVGRRPGVGRRVVA